MATNNKQKQYEDLHDSNFLDSMRKALKSLKEENSQLSSSSQVSDSSKTEKNDKSDLSSSHYLDPKYLDSVRRSLNFASSNPRQKTSKLRLSTYIDSIASSQRQQTTNRNHNKSPTQLQSSMSSDVDG